MKVIELNESRPTLDEIIGIAEQELVVLRKPDGSVFALSSLHDIDLEVELLKSNPEFMQLWKPIARNGLPEELQ